MQNSLPLSIVLVFATLAPSLAQDVTPPRQAYNTPSRTASSNLNNTYDSSSLQDQDPKTGVMGKVTSEYVDIENCFTQLIDDVEVPAEETGKLTKIFVKRGDSAQENQVIAKIDSQRTLRMLEEAQLKFDQATRRATDETAIDAANTKLQLSSEEFSDTKRLYYKGSKSKTDYKRAEYQMQIAQLELKAAINEKQLALVDSEIQEVAVNAAKDSLARHEMRASLDGEVFKVLKDSGEWVQAGETVMRIARMDKLRIHGYVSLDLFNPPDIDGRRVTAFVKLAREQIVQFEGKVTYVSLENYSDKFEIDVEIVNRKYENDPDHWILREGTSMDMRIHFD